AFRPERFFVSAVQCQAPHPPLPTERSEVKEAFRFGFRSTISNSQPSAFSRRNASEVCTSPSRKVREGGGAAGGARGVRYAPLGGGINEPTSRGDYEPRAPSDVG